MKTPVFAIIICCLLTLHFLSCNKGNNHNAEYTSGKLIIKKLTSNTYLHISFLDIPGYGPFPCNGLVYLSGKEALIFDTPTNDSASLELISWVRNEKNAAIKGVVVNHFHVDCLGGLRAFHEEGIPSYANRRTLDFAASKESIIPQNGFDTVLDLSVNMNNVISTFFGEGHTGDNIVSYFPDERLLFGGCMIKADGAGKGNLKDANVEEWPATVSKIRVTYPEVEIVVPGHGDPGGPALLDYTIELFTD